jgi:hypothetical protein
MGTDNRTVADELLAAAVRSAVEQANRAMTQASEAGLVVDLDRSDRYVLANTQPTPVLSVRVARPL